MSDRDVGAAMGDKERQECAAVTFSRFTATGERTWADYLRALDENLDFWLEGSEHWR